MRADTITTREAKYPLLMQHPREIRETRHVLLHMLELGLDVGDWKLAVEFLRNVYGMPPVAEAVLWDMAVELIVEEMEPSRAWQHELRERITKEGKQ